jgi:hypothetical protein
MLLCVERGRLAGKKEGTRLILQPEVVTANFGELASHLFSEAGDGFGMVGIFGEIGVLEGIFLHVEEFLPLAATLAILNVGPVVLAKEESFAVDAEGRVADLVLRIVKDR